MIGKKYNRLTVISYSHSNNGKYWNCLCDCGNMTVASTNQITSGLKKSCGCLKKENATKLYLKRKSLDPKTKNCSSLNKLYYRYINDAKKRRYEFNLSKSDFKQIIFENCFYCGKIPSSKLNDKDLRGQITYNGIDRINNKLDYNLNNVVPCCKHCNAAKSNMKLKDFLKMIENIHKNIKKLKSLVIE